MRITTVSLLAGTLACAALWPAASALAEGASAPVSRAVFTSAVLDREPVDHYEALNNDNVQAIFFTELTNLAGQTVTHRWEFGGKLMAEVPFTVGGDRWRVWSSKDLVPGWLGEWTVSVVDGNGAVLRSEKFLYAESAETPAVEATQPVAAPAVEAPAEGVPAEPADPNTP